MIFIADGGSTKVDWRIVDQDKNQKKYSTVGFNPFFYTTEMVIEELNKSFIHELPVQEAQKVFFYGSGCSDDYRKSILIDAFQSIFPNSQIMVEHDLLASALATCGDEPGIACILGTGSNSGLYNGEKIIDNVTSLGYLLGDEGSGTHLAKKLLVAYFYRELPVDLKNAFNDTYQLGKRELINKFYEGHDTNTFLATFAKFIFKHKDHLYIQQLVYQSFSEFIDRHIMKYENHQKLPIHFVGSIAFYFSSFLETLISERNLNLGLIIKKPIDNLVSYHIIKEQSVL